MCMAIQWQGSVSHITSRDWTERYGPAPTSYSTWESSPTPHLSSTVELVLVTELDQQQESRRAGSTPCQSQHWMS